MPIWTQTQRDFAAEIKAKGVPINNPTITRLVHSETVRSKTMKALQDAGIRLPTKEEFEKGKGEPRPYQPLDWGEVNPQTGRRRGSRGGVYSKIPVGRNATAEELAQHHEVKAQEAAGEYVPPPTPAARTTSTPVPAEAEIPITEEEKHLIRDNYRRTSQGLAPLLGDGSRPEPGKRPHEHEIEYWAEQAKKIGIWKPRTQAPPPTGSPPEAFKEHMAKLGTQTNEMTPALQQAATPIDPAVLQRLATPAPAAENFSPIRQAAARRFGKPVEPSSDGVSKILTYQNRTIGVGNSWEEAFDAAEMYFNDPPKAGSILKTDDAPVIQTEDRPNDRPAPPAPKAEAPIEGAKFIDKLGAVAREASRLLGHQLGKWYRPDGETDSRLVAACNSCGSPLEVAHPAVEGAAIKGKAYTYPCTGGA